MGILQVGFAGGLLLVVLAFASGFWLSVSGRPLNWVKLAVHKLTALGSLGLVAYVVYHSAPASGFGATQWAAITATALLFAGIIITGGLLSIERPWPGVVKSLHQRLPFVMALGICATMLLLVTPG